MRHDVGALRLRAHHTDYTAAGVLGIGRAVSLLRFAVPLGVYES